jgi:hypothetical protein
MVHISLALVINGVIFWHLEQIRFILLHTVSEECEFHISMLVHSSDQDQLVGFILVPRNFLSIHCTF